VTRRVGEKSPKNLALPIFAQKQIFNVETVKIKLATSVIKKLPKIINHPVFKKFAQSGHPGQKPTFGLKALVNASKEKKIGILKLSSPFNIESTIGKQRLSIYVSTGGHRASLQNGRQWVQIPPGCKFFLYTLQCCCLEFNRHCYREHVFEMLKVLFNILVSKSAGLGWVGVGWVDFGIGIALF
jgi:hypothetical protein